MMTESEVAKIQLPGWAEPENLADAKTAILALGRSIHEHAYILGKTLAWVKNHVGHGNFGRWLSQNVWFNERTARRFIAFSVKCSGAGKLMPYSTGKTDFMSDLREPEIDAGTLARRLAWLVEHWDKIDQPDTSDEQTPFLTPEALGHFRRSDELSARAKDQSARWVELNATLDSMPREVAMRTLVEFIRTTRDLYGEIFSNDIYCKAEYGKFLSRFSDDERARLFELHRRLSGVEDSEHKKSIYIDFLARDPLWTEDWLSIEQI